MKSLNQVTLLGNLTRDPELRQTPNGTNVCSFSLALNRSFKDASGQWKDTADYIDIVAWGPLGERISQWITKGRPLLVSGRFQTRSWEQDGQKRTKIEVVANDVVFINEPKERQSQSSQFQQSQQNQQTSPPIQTDQSQVSVDTVNLNDIPF